MVSTLAAAFIFTIANSPHLGGSAAFRYGSGVTLRSLVALSALVAVGVNWQRDDAPEKTHKIARLCSVALILAGVITGNSWIMVAGFGLEIGVSALHMFLLSYKDSHSQFGIFSDEARILADLCVIGALVIGGSKLWSLGAYGFNSLALGTMVAYGFTKFNDQVGLAQVSIGSFLYGLSIRSELVIPGSLLDPDLPQNRGPLIAGVRSDGLGIGLCLGLPVASIVIGLLSEFGVWALLPVYAGVLISIGALAAWILASIFVLGPAWAARIETARNAAPQRFHQAVA